MNAATPKADAKPTENLPTRSQFKRLRDCKTLKEAFQTDEIRELIAQAAPKFIDPQAMLRTWVQAAAKSPLIYEADMRQALGAFQSLAFLGLQPNTHLNLAHVIPFRKTRWNPTTKKRDQVSVELQVIIGYGGYVELAHRSNAITSFHADVVYDIDAEQFSFSYGTNKHLTHGGRRHDVIVGPDDSPLYAYAWARMTNGDDQFEVMPWYEVEAIRDRSQAYRQALAALQTAKEKGYRIPATWTEAPWVRDKAEMGKKTSARRFFKWVPKSPELRAASALEDAQERGDIDWGPVIDGEASPLDGNLPERPHDERDDELEGRTSVQVQKPQEPPKQEQVKQPDQPKPKVTDVPQQPSGPAFSGTIIDEFGEIASDEFTDPAGFATALVAHWRRMDQKMTEALLDHNSDMISEIATSFPSVSAILSEIEPPTEFPEVGEGDGEQQQEPEMPRYTPAVVRPVNGTDGKPDWRTYPIEIKVWLDKTPAENFPEWLNAQHDTLAAAPAQHRLAAVKAITTAFAAANLHPHPWLAEIIKPKAAQQQAPVDGETLTKDQRWARDEKVTIAGIIKDSADPSAALRAVLANAESTATKTVMARLRREGNEDRNNDSKAIFLDIKACYDEAIDTLERRGAKR